MGEYEVSVMGMESYKVEAESEEDAIIKAIDCFANDDMYWGTEEADKVTEADCFVMWYEEY
jgi:hypothetical protein